MKQLWNNIKSFMQDEEGLGTLEMLLIVAIIVVIAIAFRKWIMKWVKELFDRAETDMNDIRGMTPDEISPSATP